MLWALTAAIALQAQQLVEVPADAVVEQWTLTCNEYDQNGQATPQTYDAQVATLGTDIYIQGLAFDGAWIHGTIDGAQAVFDSRQYVGSYGGTKLYLIGYEGGDAIDLVFDYDATAGRLATQSYVLLIDGQGYTYGQMTDVVLTRRGDTPEPQPADELVVLPDGLTPQPYVLSATSISYDSDGSVAGMEPVQWPVQVAFRGTKEVYVQGVCEFLPDAWIRGTVDDGYVTFPTAQYLGRQALPVYFCGMFLGALADAEFELSGTDLLGGSYYVVINSQKSQVAPFAVLAGVSIRKYVERAATPAAPTVSRYQPFAQSEGYAVLMLDVPVRDTEGNALATDKLGYRLLTVDGGSAETPYVFTREKYVNLPEARLTVVPYDFSDGYDFYKGGSCIYMADDLGRYDRVGVQSVYTAADETRYSEVSWYQFESGTDGVASAKSAATIVGETLTDMQGRTAANPRRGLFISTQRMSDGTVRTRKVVVRK